MKKRGQILVENVVFIILNLLFLAILILFIYSKSGGEAIFEEKYSKQIALLIDSAKPGMIIHLDIEDAIKKAKNNNRDLNKIVNIEGNTVTVKLREKGGFSYSFFNDVSVSVHFDTSNKKEYFFIIKKYN